MKLSVVIPVYQVESTLDRCVESVLRQNVDDMEVILVDDGSPDHCPQMCDEWAQRDSRIKVIHKANGGLSDARNAGIEVTTGEYITFVDSDDWLEDDTYKPLFGKMADFDMIEFSIADRLHLPDKEYTDIKEYWLEAQAYTHTYACNKLFRRSLFDEVRFPKGHIFEDVYTFPSLLQKSRRIATTSHGGYHYEWNLNGITANAGGHGLSQLLEAHLQSQMPIDDRYYLYLVNIQIDVWERTGKPVILPPRRLQHNNFNQKDKLKVFLFNIFGIRTLCRISKLIHYIRKPSRL